MDWGSQGCGRSEVESGQCRLCTEPLWCNDPGSSFGFAGRIDSPEAWIDEFFDRDGGRAYGTRQCKWKPSQKDLFIASMRLRFKHRAELPPDPFGRHHDHANTWNEVNTYVDPEGVLAQALWDNLLGALYIRTAGTNDDGSDSGDLAAVRRLAAHWRSLGKEVPVFAVNAEPVYPAELISMWSANTKVDLEAAPYFLERLE